MNICSGDVLHLPSRLAPSNTNNLSGVLRIQEVKELSSVMTVIFLNCCFNSLLSPEDNQLLFISSNRGNGFMTRFRCWSPIHPGDFWKYIYQRFKKTENKSVHQMLKNIKCETSFFPPRSLWKEIPFLPLTKHCASTMHGVTHCVCLVFVMLCFQHWNGHLWAISHAE